MAKEGKKIKLTYAHDESFDYAHCLFLVVYYFKRSIFPEVNLFSQSQILLCAIHKVCENINTNK